MTSAKVSSGLLQRISEFLADLPEAQIADLAESRARPAYVPFGESEPVAPTRQTGRRATTRKAYEPSEAIKAVPERLTTVESREDAALQVADLNKTQLKDAARALSVPGYSQLQPPDLRPEALRGSAHSPVNLLRLGRAVIRGLTPAQKGRYTTARGVGAQASCAALRV